MYSAGDLRQELRHIIEDGIARGQAMPMGWIVETVMQRHPLPREFEQRGFYEHHTRCNIRIELRKTLRDYTVGDEEDEGDPRQGSLPLEGYHYLQRICLVKRDRDRVVVDIEQMSRAECEAQAARRRKMGAGCFAHAEEWDRWIAGRFGAPHAEAAE
jgi:hypothetical protein